MDWTLGESVAAASAAIAAASFVLNWAVVARQSAVQREALNAQMDGDVLHWAQDAVDALAEADLVARSRGALLDERGSRSAAAHAASRLSALADKGRFFFPNLEHPTHGQDKEAAFRGFRPPVLDALIFACQRLERLDHRNLGPDEEAAAFFVACRRLLVSEVQRAVDPRRRGKMMRRLALSAGAGPSGFREAARLGNALDAAVPGALVEPRDEAWIAAREKAARRVG